MKLEIEDARVSYGEVEALRGVSLTVNAGEIVAVLGANGAGKSTLARAISGLVARRGRILADGEAIERLRAHQIVRRGIVQVPEGRHVFPGLTVRENLVLGHLSSRAPFAERLAAVCEMFPRLAERMAQRAGTLSGGEQQMLALGRALMAQPRLLILDEPSMGLAPALVKATFAALRAINATGVTILLIEQNVNLSLEVAHRAYVLVLGRVVHQGAAQELRADQGLQALYLGGSAL
ncbi:ABC transporter ATP-binding protein [bacterium]|nr:MAG: ABC transporter ATP-binding protein [bacterium]